MLLIKTKTLVSIASRITVLRLCGAISVFLRISMRYYDVDSIDGLLADLGVSFHHFDASERGFSFRFDGALDMRMNRRARTTAADIIESYTQEQLSDIFIFMGSCVRPEKLPVLWFLPAECKKSIRRPRLVEVVSPYIDKRQEKKNWRSCFRHCASRSIKRWKLCVACCCRHVSWCGLVVG